MKRLRLVENPTDGEVALALARMEMRNAEEEMQRIHQDAVYQCQESANPIERADKWLAPRMETIEKVDAMAWAIFWRLALLTACVFVFWFVTKSF